jgi:uncharacterized protein (UPF0218 family)
MPRAYNLTEVLLSKFREPFGRLVKGPSLETMRQLKNIIEIEKPVKIVTVGDKVSTNLHKYNIIPQVSITDNRNMRRTVETECFPSKKIIRIKNPKGTITEEAIESIKEAVEGDVPIQIVVDGEEDLLTLIAVIYAPYRSLVIYGQPKKGIVLINVDLQKKSEAKEILAEMEVRNL